MSTTGIADVVFCIDASESMRPCIDALRKHIVDFLSGLKSPNQPDWDLRLDFVAHRAGEADGSFLFELQSLYNDDLIHVLYWEDRETRSQGRFFTSDLNEFARGLDVVEVHGDEAPLVALDACLDFPWRDAMNCHRVIIMLTDEPFETGVAQAFQKAKLAALIDKIQKLGVMFFLVAPNSEVFTSLSAVDRSAYEEIEAVGDGLTRIKFGEVLRYIGKSVSVSNFQWPRGSQHVERGLYGQIDWKLKDKAITGR